MKRPKLLLLIAPFFVTLLNDLTRGSVPSRGKAKQLRISVIGPNASRRTLVMVLLLTTIMVALTAVNVTATYTPESPLYFQKSPGVFTHPTVYGTKLGRLTIVADGPIYNPTILISGIDASYNVVMIGPVRWSVENPWNYNFEVNMNVLAVSYPNGLGGPLAIRAIKDKQPLLGAWSNEQVTTSPFYVDIYLVNCNDRGFTTNPHQEANLNTTGVLFKSDSPFTFKYPFNPYYTVGVTDTISQGPYVFPETGNPTQGQFIPIDGVVGQATTPVVDPSGYTTPEDEGDGFWFGDNPPQTVNFLFSFQYDTFTFDITEAYGNDKKIINVAQMNVQNGVSGTTYKQYLTFTDTGSATTFQLKPDGVSGNHIDFNLYFGTSLIPIPYGQAIEWTGLVPNMNYKDLKIGGIQELQVNQCVSGSYKDTITVNITAADN